MDPRGFVDGKVAEISAAVGDQRALVALSGGVDSATVAALAHRALGDRLRSVFLDDGLMRVEEAEQVTADMARAGVTVEVREVAGEFFAALRGIADPEDKRKAFRDTFYRVLGRLVAESGCAFMLQGTIAADVIETARGVKTQHNVLEQIGVDPKGYGLTILEPLKELFKPDVRLVARELGLPPAISERMPFPGPGLATRIVGEVTPERTQTVRAAGAIVEEELALAGIHPFQCFAVLLDDRATGLAGEGRAFGQIVVIRSVNSENAMTAEPTEIPFAVLRKMQRRITDEIADVTRVLYDLTPKPPATIEYV